MLLVAATLLGGCAAGHSAKEHHSIEHKPDSRPLQQVVPLPVDVDVDEMSAGGVKEEVPEWSDVVGDNVRNALLVSKDPDGRCCVTREVDSSSLINEESDILEEHLALFNSVAAMPCGQTCRSTRPFILRRSMSTMPWAWTCLS